MPKFSVNATELSNTDVNFVALVKRGANRIPFRITKSEETDMIDLHKIGRRLFKTADPEPTVIACIVEKSADIEAVSAALKSAGIDVTPFVKAEKDGIVTLTKADAVAEDVMLVKMAGGVALAISNLSKAFDGYDFQSPDFGEVHSKGSHIASMSTAADSLHRTIGNVLENAKDPKEAASQISDACDAHKAHVAKLTSALPTHAFKADQALVKVAKAADARKHPHAGVALAIAHAAHQAAAVAGQAAEMISGGGTNADPPIGGDLGDKANMKKSDAGQNGAGAGFEQGAGTETTASATADDKENTEVNAKPGETVSGESSGLPAKAKAKKTELLKAELAVAEAKLALAKAETVDVTTEEVDGAEPGDAESAGGKDESDAATARASSDDAANAGGKVAGKVKGKTLDAAGIPDGAVATTQKNDGDGDIGKKAKGNQLHGDQSGAGAQEKDVQTLKADDPIMKALQAMSKSVSESIAAVTKSLTDLNTRVEQVAEQATKTDAALNGTVFNDAGGDNPARTQKSEASGAPPLLDTAYTRR